MFLLLEGIHPAIKSTYFPFRPFRLFRLYLWVAQTRLPGSPFPCGGWSETVISLKTCLSTKLQKLQSRHFHESRARWGRGCETSFISLYHQAVQCQAEIPCWQHNCLLVRQKPNSDRALPASETKALKRRRWEMVVYGLLNPSEGPERVVVFFFLKDAAGLKRRI